MRVALITLLAVLSVAPAMAQGTPPTAGTSPAVSPPAAGTPPAAGQRRRMRMVARFEAANTSHDGKLTLDQAKAANMRQVVQNFDGIDAQHRGYVTMDDIRAYRRTQRAARRAAQPAK